MRSILAGLLLASVMVPAAAFAAQHRIGEESVIDDAGNGGIRGYDIVARDTLFVRDRRNNWYKLSLTSDCFKSTVPQAVSFKTDASGRLDRMSKIRTREHLCGIASIVAAPPPPSEKSRSN